MIFFRCQFFWSRIIYYKVIKEGLALGKIQIDDEVDEVNDLEYLNKFDKFSFLAQNLSPFVIATGVMPRECKTKYIRQDLFLKSIKSLNDYAEKPLNGICYVHDLKNFKEDQETILLHCQPQVRTDFYELIFLKHYKEKIHDNIKKYQELLEQNDEDLKKVNLSDDRYIEHIPSNDSKREQLEQRISEDRKDIKEKKKIEQKLKRNQRNQNNIKVIFSYKENDTFVPWMNRLLGTYCSYLGVPDSSDIGGGVWSYSSSNWHDKRLIGITIEEVEEGMQSRALNLLNPQLRATISEMIDKYYIELFSKEGK